MPEVKVEAKDGTVTIYDGREPASYKIVNHKVTVADKDLRRFLRQVGGKEIESKPDSGKAGG